MIDPKPPSPPTSLELQIALDPLLKRINQQIEDRFAHVKYEYVDVLFEFADTDVDVRTRLTPFDPESIDYHQVRADGPGVVYNDHSVNRRPWGKGYVTLRCSADMTQVRLMLVERKEGGRG